MSMILFVSIIFLIIFVFIGIPVSMLVDLTLVKLKPKSKYSELLSSIFFYCLGGIIATVIFYIVSERELFYRFFEKDMIFFYIVGIISSITFYIIENLIKKIR